MLIRKNILLLLLLFALSCPAIAQPTIGIPAIKNYTHTDYNAGTEIWGINQGKNGMLYFANDEGLLSFDGSYWKIYQMTNKAAIKSVAIDAAGRIYCGGQDEVGYFFPDNNGILKFHSLKNLLPRKARQFADIWDVVVINNEVFFRTIECIFELKDNELKTFDAPGGWRLLAKVGSQLYAEDRDSGLMFFKNNQWQHCCGTLSTTGLQVTGITDYKKDTLLLTTLKKGLFLLTASSLTHKSVSIDNILSKDLVTCTKKIADDRYAIGTAANGVFIIDGSGNQVGRFSINEGLQNNHVHAILTDHDKNLWLGLENGLGFINYNTSVKHIYIDKENQVKGNAAIVFDKKLFVGTTNGLYSIPLNGQQTDISKGKGIFTEVDNTRGLVYNLSDITGSLAIAQQEGAMILRGNRAEPIATGHGAWIFKPIPGSPDIVISTYTGLQLLQNTGGKLTDAGKIPGIYESLPVLARDNTNTIWASHPYRGIYRIQLSPDRKRIVIYTQYTDKNGLPSVLNNQVYFLRNKIIAGTEKGVYEYSGAKNKFVRSAYFNPIFGDAPVQYLTEDKSGNIWFISNQRVGVVDFSKPTSTKPYNVIYFPELSGQVVKGSGFIYPYDAENVFVGSTNGIYHLNYRQYVATENKLNVLLTTVKTIAEKDSLIFGGYFMKNNKVANVQYLKQTPKLTNHWNSFHFEYSSTLFAQKGNEEFSYKLTGFDKEWSKWSAKTEKDYTNLPYGTYTFSVIARNNLGNASAPVNYTFKVEPASYQTAWAYFFYVLIIAGIIIWAAKAQHRKFELQQKMHDDEQRRLQYLHSLELDRNDKEIIALKNENLETELNYKNKELATLTMHLVDRGRLLLNIKDELMVLTKKLNIPDPAYQFRSVFRMLSDTDKKDDDWNHFAMYFDQVHNNFLSTMKTKFPGLSSTDLKLCAYLRLNLTSKEIAQLLNISLKGVEISRYRVRKKLGLSTEVHLYDFLIEITN
ncbi:MAG: transcriptional regulator [Bacteroidota bacterium]|nr:transcriptional regulator [Bacteroidota bacterium]